jgi:hypothetical protein
MSDSNKKFPKGADFYYQERYFYYKDWYWYFPEWLKYLVVALSILTTPFFVSFLYSGFDSGEYFYTLIFVAIWLWSGILGTADAWWMPEKITHDFKYRPRVTSEIPNLASYGIAIIFFIIIASPITFTKWVISIFTWILPSILLFFILAELFYMRTDGQEIVTWIAVVLFTWPYWWGLGKISEKGKAFRKSSLDSINALRKSVKLKKNTEFRNIEYDITQLCMQKTAIEAFAFILIVNLLGLLIIDFV